MGYLYMRSLYWLRRSRQRFIRRLLRGCAHGREEEQRRRNPAERLYGNTHLCSPVGFAAPTRYRPEPRTICAVLPSTRQESAPEAFDTGAPSTVTASGDAVASSMVAVVLAGMVKSYTVSAGPRRQPLSTSPSAD